MSKMKYYVVVVTVLFHILLLSYEIETKTIPSYIKRCKKSDPNLGKCVANRVMELKPKLLEGIPEFGIPKIEPLVIYKLDISSGPFRAVLKDIQVFGISDMDVRDLYVDLDNPKIRLHLYMPNCKINMNYQFYGKIMMIEFNSEGKGYLMFNKINAFYEMDGSVVTKKEKSYLDMRNTFINVTYTNPYLHFENIFRGNQQLTQETNRILNEHINVTAAEIKPIVEKAIGEYVGKTLQGVLSDYSIDELYES